MATFVMVHGAMHGGWCWRRVNPLLRAAGHEIVTPTLTGLGERIHLAHPDIDLETHVQDVLAVLEYEDLNDIISGWAQLRNTRQRWRHRSCLRTSRSCRIPR